MASAPDTPADGDPIGVGPIEVDPLVTGSAPGGGPAGRRPDAEHSVGRPPPGEARTVVDAFFARLGAGDIGAWLELIADDVVVDTPFSPAGDAIRFEGLEAVDRRFGDARRR